MDVEGTLDSDYTKKEAAEFKRNYLNLITYLELEIMERVPDAIYVVDDVKMEELPVKKKLTIRYPCICYDRCKCGS